MILVKLGVTLLVLTAIFAVIHWLWASEREQRFWRRGASTDVIWWFFRFTIVDFLGRLTLGIPFVIAGLLLGFTPDVLRGGEYHGFGPMATLPTWVQAIAFVLLFDLAGYWTHRLFHGGRWWRYHAVHHSPEQLDWLSAIRVHPVNELVGNFLTMLPLLALGFDPYSVIPIVPIAGFYAILVHANLDWTYGPLRLVIASPVFHRWHHSAERAAWDKNFAGLFPVWDVIFGTLYFPKDRLPREFGISQEMPASFWGQMAFPFRPMKSKE